MLTVHFHKRANYNKLSFFTQTASFAGQFTSTNIKTVFSEQKIYFKEVVLNSGGSGRIAKQRTLLHTMSDEPR